MLLNRYVSGGLLQWTHVSPGSQYVQISMYFKKHCGGNEHQHLPACVVNVISTSLIVIDWDREYELLMLLMQAEMIQFYHHSFQI